jgi:glutathione synthase
VGTQIKRIGFWMDPIESIKPYKDTSFALMLAAQDLGHGIVYLPKNGLSLDHGEAKAIMQEVKVTDGVKDNFATLGDPVRASLTTLDVILIRVDPPFDSEYLYGTHILERAKHQGVQVVNNPQAIRDCNEKLFATEFSALMPKTVVSSKHEDIREFQKAQGDIILKPLDGMGGSRIFRITADGLNLGAVLETLSPNESRLVMAQEYRPEIVDGDRRVLVLHGKPISHVLARIPSQGETRGNLAAGGRGVAMPISDREREIAETVGPILRERGLLFVGLDVIGGHLTEINVTSPTCVREIDAQAGKTIGHDFFKALFNE